MGALTLVRVMTCLCRDLGVPETATTDGGTQFTANAFQNFLKQHCIEHRLSSVAFPHANCRAEVAVKTAKRLIKDNVCADGKLDSVKLTRALLNYRNTPDRATGLSPAEMLLGRQLRDFLPGKPVSTPVSTSADLSRTWCEVSEWREMALSKRSTKAQERLTANTKELPTLGVGQSVLVQNQVGNQPRKWDKRGVIVEVLPFRQYKVMLDGSRRLTLRNRKFLRAFTPVIPRISIPRAAPCIEGPNLPQSASTSKLRAGTPAYVPLGTQSPDVSAAATTRTCRQSRVLVPTDDHAPVSRAVPVAHPVDDGQYEYPGQPVAGPLLSKDVPVVQQQQFMPESESVVQPQQAPPERSAAQPVQLTTGPSAPTELPPLIRRSARVTEGHTTKGFYRE